MPWYRNEPHWNGMRTLGNFVLFPTTGDHMASSKAGPSRITELPNELTTDIDTCSPEVSENQPEVLNKTLHARNISYGKGGWGMSCIYWHKYGKVTFSFPVLRLSFLSVSSF